MIQDGRFRLGFFAGLEASGRMKKSATLQRNPGSTSPPVKLSFSFRNFGGVVKS